MGVPGITVLSARFARSLANAKSFVPDVRPDLGLCIGGADTLRPSAGLVVTRRSERTKCCRPLRCSDLGAMSVRHSGGVSANPD
jgi:hypothetical protein